MHLLPVTLTAGVVGAAAACAQPSAGGSHADCNPVYLGQSRVRVSFPKDFATINARVNPYLHSNYVL